jgi:CRP/FNR family transcriptional regulator
LEATECIILEAAALQDSVSRHPALAWHLLRHLAKLVRESNDAVESLASRDVTGRVALLLLRLAENHGTPYTPAGKASGTRIPITLTKTDIKSFVGATREHVTNIMNEFTKAGFITTDPATNHIVILKPDGLLKRIQ